MAGLTKEQKEKLLKELVRLGNFVMVNKHLVRHWGMAQAMIFAYMCDKWKYYKFKPFYYTLDDFREQLNVGKPKIRTCIRALIDCGVIKTCGYLGTPAKLYYDINIERAYELVKSLSRNYSNKKVNEEENFIFCEDEAISKEQECKLNDSSHIQTGIPNNNKNKEIKTEINNKEYNPLTPLKGGAVCEGLKSDFSMQGKDEKTEKQKAREAKKQERLTKKQKLKQEAIAYWHELAKVNTDIVPLEKWEEWIDYRLERTSIIPKVVFIKQLKESCRLDSATIISKIDKAIMSGWQAFIYNNKPEFKTPIKQKEPAFNFENSVPDNYFKRLNTELPIKDLGYALRYELNNYCHKEAMRRTYKAMLDKFKSLPQFANMQDRDIINTYLQRYGNTELYQQRKEGIRREVDMEMDKYYQLLSNDDAQLKDLVLKGTFDLILKGE